MVGVTIKIPLYKDPNLLLEFNYKTKLYRGDEYEKNNHSGLFDKKKIKDFISSTFGCDEFSTQIEINNRNFSCNGFNNSFLWVSFNKFFHEPSSSAEYIEICKKYDWILINEFNKCNDDEADKVRRFISFIDVSYKENTKVKFFNEGFSYRGAWIYRICIS